MSPVNTRGSTRKQTAPGEFPIESSSSKGQLSSQSDESAIPPLPQANWSTRESNDEIYSVLHNLSSLVSKLQKGQEDLQAQLSQLNQFPMETTSKVPGLTKKFNANPNLTSGPPLGTMGFPTLSSTKEGVITDWISDIESVLYSNDITIERFEWALPLFLKGPSKELWKRLKKSLPSNRTPTWETYKQRLLETENPTARQLELRTQLSNKKFLLGSSIKQHCIAFQALEELIPSENMSFDDRFAYFFRSISNCRDIQRELKRENIKDMSKAYQITSSYEEDYLHSHNKRPAHFTKSNKPFGSLMHTAKEGKSSGSSLLYCKYCKKSIGHTIDNCPKLQQKKQNMESKETKYSEQLDFLEEDILDVHNLDNLGELGNIELPNSSTSGRAIPRYMVLVNDQPLITIIDSGASHNYISSNIADKMKLTKEKIPPFTVRLANGLTEEVLYNTTIAIYIEKASIEINCSILKLQNKVELILGQPWLQEIQPQIDFLSGICKIKINNTFIDFLPIKSNLTVLNTNKESDVINKFKLQFPQLFRVALGTPKDRKIKHHIDTGDHQPVRVSPYPMSPAKLQIINNFVCEGLKNGTITKSKSEWSSPLLLVPKKDNSYRVCVDFRGLNRITKKDGHPLPRVDECFRLLAGAKFFTSLDLKSGYWQIGLDEESQEKTAFSTRNGHFHFLVMPFGLTNAPATFQRFINSILEPYLDISVIVYLDDILIYSKDYSTHLVDVRNILAALDTENLVLNLEKCLFFQKQVRFLGHLITSEGISTDPAKVDKINSWPIPNNITELRGFLALCSYYRKFIEGFSNIAYPLTELTKGNPKKKASIIWNNKCQDSFVKLKMCITSSPVLQQADYSKPFIINSDASNYAVGAVLQQEFLLHGKPVLLPLAFESKKLTPTQQNYSTQERELLAILCALESWAYIIEGSDIIVNTDHESLKYVFSQAQPGRRIARFLDRLAHFSPQINYIPGKHNVVPDVLSRCTHNFETVDVPSEVLVLETESEVYYGTPINDIILYLQDPKELSTKDFTHDKLLKLKSISSKFLLKDKQLYLIKGLRLVPYKDRQQATKLIKETHELQGHLGIDGIYQTLRNELWCPKLYDLVVSECNLCSTCQVFNKTPNAMSPVSPLEPVGIFERWGLDHVGPLVRSKQGSKHIITAIDYCSGYALAFACGTADEKSATQMVTHIINYFGAPNTIITDKGTAFTSTTFRYLLLTNKIQHNTTSGYHPRSNGRIERFNGILEKILRLQLHNQPLTHWENLLPNVLRIYRQRKNIDGYSPLYLATGRIISDSGSTSADSVQLANLTLQKRIAEVNKLRFVQGKAAKIKYERAIRRATKEENNKCLVNYQIGDWVLRRRIKNNKLEPEWDGPYEVINSTPQNTYQLKSPGGFQLLGTYSVDRLRPAYGQDTPNKLWSGKEISGRNHRLVTKS